MEPIGVALVHDLVNQRAIIGLDLADLTAHTTVDLHAIPLGFPSLLAGEMQKQIAVLVPGVKVLVTR